MFVHTTFFGTSRNVYENLISYNCFLLFVTKWLKLVVLNPLTNKPLNGSTQFTVTTDEKHNQKEKTKKYCH